MKFINLLKKELKELINVQMIATLGIMLMIFMIMGNLMTTAINDVVEDASHPTINISDIDDTELSKQLISALKNTEATVKELSFEGDDYAKILSDNKIKNLVVIPEGFTESLEKGGKPKLMTVSKMESAATMANLSTGNTGAVALIESCVKNIIAEQNGLGEEELERLNSPIELTENTVVDKKWAPISIEAITAKVSLQNMALPIALLFLVLMTSQSLISSISSEKIDKTLETLLSAPVSRMSVISAKMLAAAIVALINAGVMMIGFTVFMKDAASSMDSETIDTAKQMLSTGDAFERLGLNLTAGDYLLVGLQFFFTIMICLSISIILGSLANDAKAAYNAHGNGALRNIDVRRCKCTSHCRKADSIRYTVHTYFHIYEQSHVREYGSFLRRSSVSDYSICNMYVLCTQTFQVRQDTYHVAQFWTEVQIKK